MKQLLFTVSLPVFIALFVFACSSPTDIPASRKITNDPPSISIEKSKDIGRVSPKQARTFTVEIANSSATDSVTITDVKLQDGTKGFELVSPVVPVRLGRKGETDKITITVSFTATVSGEYHDKIIINGNTSLSCDLAAMLVDDAITVDDVDFGLVEYGTKRDIKANITNNGDALVTIISATLQGVVMNDQFIEDFLYLSLPTLPVQIKPGESGQFWVVLNGAEPGQHNATLEFQMEYSGSGTVDNVSVLTGTVGN